MKILRTLETAKNPRGLCAMSSKIVKKTNDQGEEEEEGTLSSLCLTIIEQASFIAFPHGAEASDILICEALEAKAEIAIRAHKSSVSALQFNSDASMLATSSNKGTVIRIFAVPSSDLLYTLR